MKFCKDCRHAKAGGYVIGPCSYTYVPWRCKNPEQLDCVTGMANASCESARNAYVGKCGESGKLWEEGTPEPLPEPIRIVREEVEVVERPSWLIRLIKKLRG